MKNMKHRTIISIAVLLLLLLNSSPVFSYANSTLAISGATQPPTTHTQGQLFDCRGTITSNYSITSVTVGVWNSSGTMVTGGTAWPNTASFDVIKLDLQVKFRELTAGSYTYQVIASDSSGITKTLVNKNFTLVSPNTPAPSTLSISGATQPPATHTLGQMFDCKGTVSSNYDITYVTAYVYNSSGGTVTGGFAVPNAKSYNIVNLDTQIKFRELPAGTYSYQVRATDASGLSLTLVEKEFTVVSATVPVSALTISNHTLPGAQHIQGSVFYCKGIITSNFIITQVTVGVYNSSGTMITGGLAAPNTSSYNIANIDPQVMFRNLGAGKYSYIIKATDKSGMTKQLASSVFEVAANPSGSQNNNFTKPIGLISFGYPLKSKVTQTDIFCPYSNYHRQHKGVDLRCAAGSDVIASASGKIYATGNDGDNKGRGKYVVIDHGNNIYTAYYHLNSITRTSGSVNKGEVIAKSGNTGNSTGAHLHFEISIGGYDGYGTHGVDPGDYVNEIVGLKDMQRYLIGFGYNLNVTGVYDKQTQEAVTQFQIARKLPYRDGIVGETTLPDIVRAQAAGWRKP